MLRKLHLIPALCALVLAAATQAQTTVPEGSKPVPRADVPVQARMSMHVGALVLEDLKQYVTDDEKLGALYLRMLLLAKQEAIAASCAGYDLDKDRRVTLMLRTMRPLAEGMENGVASANLQRGLRQYNTLLGGELAQFAYEPTGYCNAAEDLVKELGEYPEAESMLVLKSGS